MGLGFTLYVNDLQKILFEANMGGGSNNQGELLACYYLLKLLYQKNIHSAQVSGDSSPMINHLKGAIRITILPLHTFAHWVIRAIEALQQVNFTHVYRENNMEEDQLSKDGLLLNPRSFSITSVADDRAKETVELILHTRLLILFHMFEFLTIFLF